MFTPLNLPHVDTLKSKQAVESKGEFAIEDNFRFGLSSISKIGGHVFGSIETAASRDFNNLIIDCIERTMTLFETSTIILTVGRVVIKFWG